MLRKFLINDGIHDSGCTLKSYKKECFDKVNLMGEMHRFIPATLAIYGFKVGELEVNHRPRIHGITKYNYKRTIKGFLDILGVWFWMKYASRPLHLFGGAGLFSFVLGGILLIALFAARIFYGYSLSDKVWPLLAIFFMMVGYYAGQAYETFSQYFAYGSIIMLMAIALIIVISIYYKKITARFARHLERL